MVTLRTAFWIRSLMTASGAMLLTAGAAHAGHWNVTYSVSRGARAGSSTSLQPVRQLVQHGRLTVQSGLEQDSASQTTLTIDTALTWIADRPRDNAPPSPKVYVREDAQARVQGPALNVRLADGPPDAAHANGNKAGDSLLMRRFSIVDNQQRHRIVRLQRYLLRASMPAASNAARVAAPKVAAAPQLKLTYIVKPVQLQVGLKVRLRGTRRYAATANVAAGGIASPEHHADVEISIQADGLPFPGVPVDPLEIIDSDGHNGEGVVVDAKLTLAGSERGAVTDSQGLVHGDFSSSDIMRAVTLHFSAKNLQEWALTSKAPTATIGQKWDDSSSSWNNNDMEFQYGQPSKTTFSPQFYRDADPHLPDIDPTHHDASPKSQAPDSEDGEQPEAGAASEPVLIPVTKHHISFHKISITGMRWNPAIGPDWTGPDGKPDGKPDGDFEPVFYGDDAAKAATGAGHPEDTAAQAWRDRQALVTFAPTTEDPPGTYNVEVTTTATSDFSPDATDYGVEDADVYDD